MVSVRSAKLNLIRIDTLEDFIFKYPKMKVLIENDSPAHSFIIETDHFNKHQERVEFYQGNLSKDYIMKKVRDGNHVLIDFKENLNHCQSNSKLRFSNTALTHIQVSLVIKRESKESIDMVRSTTKQKQYNSIPLLYILDNFKTSWQWNFGKAAEK